MDAYLGYFAALGTSVAWSFSSAFFTLAGRRLGSPIVNRTRLVLALVFVVIMHWLMLGQPFPTGAEPFRWLWMGLSGLIGYVFGDGFLFQAFVMIGPRLSMLIMALVPVFSTLLGWLLEESLAPLELVGIALSVGGVMLVVADRRNGKPALPATNGTPASTVANSTRPESANVLPRRQYVLGLLYALGGAIGQAGGLFASRLGLVDGYPALSGNLMRLVVAGAAMWLFALLTGSALHTFRRLREEPRALGTLVGGSFVGPFLGVWLSLVAVQLAPLGIASTLMSLSPVILLPIGLAFFKESITRRAVIGTLIALAGTVLLFV